MHEDTTTKHWNMKNHVAKSMTGHESNVFCQVSTKRKDMVALPVQISKGPTHIKHNTIL